MTELKQIFLKLPEILQRLQATSLPGSPAASPAVPPGTDPNTSSQAGAEGLWAARADLPVFAGLLPCPLFPHFLKPMAK